jgi:hypothetical protein
MLPPRRCSRGALRAVAAARDSLSLRLGTPTISVRYTARNPVMPHAARIPAAPPTRGPSFPRRSPPPNPAATRTSHTPARSMPAGARGLNPRGARTRAGYPCRSPAIHGKLRCRMHGGRSPGPRTPDSLPRRRPGGRTRVRDARTTRGNYGADARAENRFRLTMLRISRVDIALDRYQAHLAPAFAARLRGHPPEPMPPPRPRGGITAAEDRAMRHAVAASLAPWRAAIAEARPAHRAARIAARSTQRAARAPAADGQTRTTHTSASSSPPAPPPVPIAPCTGDGLLEGELAARAAGLRAPAIRPPQSAPTPGSTAPFKPFRTDPLNREPTAKPGSTVPFKPFRTDPSNREPTAKPGPTAPFKPFRTDPLNREPTAKPGSTVPFKPFRTDPLNREPAAKPGSTAPFKPFRTDPLNREPTAKPGSTAPFKSSRTDPLHLIPPRRRPSTAPRAAASNTSSAAATASPARPHGPAPRPGQSGEGRPGPLPLAFLHPIALTAGACTLDPHPPPRLNPAIRVYPHPVPARRGGSAAPRGFAQRRFLLWRDHDRV